MRTIGIDFGTSNSAVALADGDKPVRVAVFPRPTELLAYDEAEGAGRKAKKKEREASPGRARETKGEDPAVCHVRSPF